MLQQLAKPALIVLAITSFLWIFYRIILFSTKKRPASSNKELFLFLFVVYMVFVALLTLYPLPMTSIKVPGAKGVNFIPFENTMKEFAESAGKRRAFMRSHTVENIIGNIFLFVPFGIFLPLISKKFRSLGKVFLFGLLFSLLIETLQLVSRQMGVYRSVDIDDVILNVFGTVCGYVLVSMLYLGSQPRKHA
jgi:glycopeptide antibiotics resistance protein